MGDASSVRLAIAEETTFGTNPGSGFYYLRFNSESLKLDINNIQSAEIDPTRQPSGAIRVGTNASGDIVAEDSLVNPNATPAGFDSLLEGACMNDFSTIVSLSTQNLVLTTTTGGTFKITSSGTPFANVEVGHWVKMGGFATNGTIYGLVTTRTSSADADFTGVRSTGLVPTSETNTASGTVTASTLKIGITKKSYTIERAYSDLTVPEYSLYTGMRVARWNLRLNSNAIFQHSFGFLGQVQATTTTTAAGSPGAKWTFPRLEAVDHFKMKMIGAFTNVAEATPGSGLIRVESIDFTLDNALRTEPELGFSGSRDIGIGTPKIDGTIVMYMTNADQVRLAEAGTRSKLAFRLDDGTRQRIISMGSILFGTPDIGAKGNNDSVRVSLPFTAESDANNIAIAISRF